MITLAVCQVLVCGRMAQPTTMLAQVYPAEWCTFISWERLQDWLEAGAFPAQVHTRKLRLDADVDDEVLRQVARDLPGLSGKRRQLSLAY